MHVRHLRDRADLEGLIRAHGAAWQAAYDDVLPAEVLDRIPVDPSPEDVDRQHDRLLPNSDRVLVATVDGEVVGYAFVRWDETKAFVGEDEAGLKEIYVHPDHWGEGVGTALLERGMELLPGWVEALKLEVLAENDVGRGFYEARGFERVGETTTELAGEAYDAAIYERSV